MDLPNLTRSIPPLALVLFCSAIYPAPLFAQNTRHRNIHVDSPDKEIDTYISTIKRKSPKGKYTYYWFDNTSIHHTQGGYADYLLDGEYKEYYYPSKNLLTNGHYHYGLKTGRWNTWYENGAKQETTTWKHGRLSGKKYIYNTKGKLLKQERYRNGLLDGKTIEMDSIDNVKTLYYHKGLLLPAKPTFLKEIGLKKNDKLAIKEKNAPNTKSYISSDKKPATTPKKTLWERIKNIF